MKVNEKYDRDIASKFTITLGDEFQGLLCNGKNIIKIIFEIENCMWPIDIRFGIGIEKLPQVLNGRFLLAPMAPDIIEPERQ